MISLLKQGKYILLVIWKMKVSISAGSAVIFVQQICTNAVITCFVFITNMNLVEIVF